MATVPTSPLAPPPGGEPSFQDGLGIRYLAADEVTGDRLERLCVSYELGKQAAAIQERVTRLVNFRHPRFPRIRGVEVQQLQGGPGVVWVYADPVDGIRLFDLLVHAERGRIVLDVNTALQLAREVLPALATLHDSRSVTHGAIGPERLVLTRQARVMMVDHAFGAALPRLRYPRTRLWREFRIAMPPSAGQPQFDARADVAMVALTVLAALVGRPLATSDFPDHLRDLLDRARERHLTGKDRPLSASLRAWLERTLPFESRRPIATALEAQVALEEAIKKERSYAPGATALKQFIERAEPLFPQPRASMPAVDAAEAPPEPAPPLAIVRPQPPARPAKPLGRRPPRVPTPEEEEAEEIAFLERELARIAAEEAAQRPAAATASTPDGGAMAREAAGFPAPPTGAPPLHVVEPDTVAGGAPHAGQAPALDEPTKGAAWPEPTPGGVEDRDPFGGEAVVEIIAEVPLHLDDSRVVEFNEYSADQLVELPASPVAEPAAWCLVPPPVDGGAVAAAEEPVEPAFVDRHTRWFDFELMDASALLPAAASSSAVAAVPARRSRRASRLDAVARTTATSALARAVGPMAPVVAEALVAARENRTARREDDATRRRKGRGVPPVLPERVAEPVTPMCPAPPPSALDTVVQRGVAPIALVAGRRARPRRAGARLDRAALPARSSDEVALPAPIPDPAIPREVASGQRLLKLSPPAPRQAPQAPQRLAERATEVECTLAVAGVSALESAVRVATDAARVLQVPLSLAPPVGRVASGPVCLLDDRSATAPADVALVLLPPVPAERAIEPIAVDTAIDVIAAAPTEPVAEAPAVDVAAQSEPDAVVEAAALEIAAVDAASEVVAEPLPAVVEQDAAPVEAPAVEAIAADAPVAEAIVDEPVTVVVELVSAEPEAEATADAVVVDEVPILEAVAAEPVAEAPAVDVAAESEPDAVVEAAAPEIADADTVSEVVAEPLPAVVEQDAASVEAPAIEAIADDAPVAEAIADEPVTVVVEPVSAAPEAEAIAEAVAVDEVPILEVVAEPLEPVAQAPAVDVAAASEPDAVVEAAAPEIADADTVSEVGAEPLPAVVEQDPASVEAPAAEAIAEAVALDEVPIPEAVAAEPTEPVAEAPAVDVAAEREPDVVVEAAALEIADADAVSEVGAEPLPAVVEQDAASVEAPAVAAIAEADAVDEVPTLEAVVAEPTEPVTEAPAVDVAAAREPDAVVEAAALEIAAADAASGESVAAAPAESFHDPTPEVPEASEATPVPAVARFVPGEGLVLEVPNLDATTIRPVAPIEPDQQASAGQEPSGEGVASGPDAAGEPVAAAPVDLDALIEELRAIEDAESQQASPGEPILAPVSWLPVIESVPVDAEVAAGLPQAVSAVESPTFGSTDVPPVAAEAGVASPEPPPDAARRPVISLVSPPARTPAQGGPVAGGPAAAEIVPVRPADKRRRKRGTARRRPAPAAVVTAPPAPVPVSPPVAPRPTPDPTPAPSLTIAAAPEESAPGPVSPQLAQRKAHTSGRESWSVVAMRSDQPADIRTRRDEAAGDALPAPEDPVFGPPVAAASGPLPDIDATLPNYAPWLAGDPLPPGAAEATPLAATPVNPAETDRASVYSADPVAPTRPPAAAAPSAPATSPAVRVLPFTPPGERRPEQHPAGEPQVAPRERAVAPRESAAVAHGAATLFREETPAPEPFVVAMPASLAVEPPPRAWRRTLAASVAAMLVAGAAFAAYWLTQSAPTGTLVVQASIEGVEVFVDGHSRGRAPLNLELPAGRHTIEMRGPGATKSFPVEIAAGVSTTQNVKWPTPGRPTGSLRVTSTPPGARVLLDGEVRGMTPVVIEDVSAGSHTVTLESEAGSVRRAVKVEVGATASVDASIFAGWLQVFAPFQVTVFTKGRPVGSDEDGKLMLPSGTHQLEFVNEGLGVRLKRAVEITPGGTTPVSIEAPRGSVAVEAPDGTEVWIDGELKGTTPLPPIGVTVGTREVVLRHPQLGQRRRVPQVGASEPTRVTFTTP